MSEHPAGPVHMHARTGWDTMCGIDPIGVLVNPHGSFTDCPECMEAVAQTVERALIDGTDGDACKGCGHRKDMHGHSLRQDKETCGMRDCECLGFVDRRHPW